MAPVKTQTSFNFWTAPHNRQGFFIPWLAHFPLFDEIYLLLGTDSFTVAGTVSLIRYNTAAANPLPRQLAAWVTGAQGAPEPVVQ